jgi:phage gp29-like protein
MLIKFNPEHVDEPGQVLNDNREVFQFSDRVKNASLLQKFNDAVWRKEFIPFDIPRDWKVEDKVFAPPAVDNLRAANNPAAQNPIK